MALVEADVHCKAKDGYGFSRLHPRVVGLPTVWVRPVRRLGCGAAGVAVSAVQEEGAALGVAERPHGDGDGAGRGGRGRALQWHREGTGPRAISGLRGVCATVERGAGRAGGRAGGELGGLVGGNGGNLWAVYEASWTLDASHGLRFPVRRLTPLDLALRNGGAQNVDGLLKAARARVLCKPYTSTHTPTPTLSLPPPTHAPFRPPALPSPPSVSKL
jgi:hypothetical protein